MSRLTHTDQHLKPWNDTAKQLHRIRAALATLTDDTILLAREGIVSSDMARPIIVGRTLEYTRAATEALVKLEQTVRNEAARLERRGPRP